MVYYGQDSVRTITSGELGDQIHSHYLEGECRGVRRDMEQGDFSFVGEDFVLLAWGASFYVICSPFLQSRPPVVGSDPLDRLVASWVPSRWLPVVVVQDFSFQCFIWRDHEPVLCTPKFETRDCGGFLEREGEFGLSL